MHLDELNNKKTLTDYMAKARQWLDAEDEKVKRTGQWPDIKTNHKISNRAGGNMRAIQRLHRPEEINELNVNTLINTKSAIEDPSTMKSRTRYQITKDIEALPRLNKRIQSKQHPETQLLKTLPTPSYNSYEDYLAEQLSQLLKEDDNAAKGFTDILKKQHNEKPAAPKAATVDVPYYNWTIRYRPDNSGKGKVDWIVLNKRGELVHRGVALSDKDAVSDAQEFIDRGTHNDTVVHGTVDIDFNINFTKEFASDGVFFANIIGVDGVPVLKLSKNQASGLKKGHIRSMNKTTDGAPLMMIAMGNKEANNANLRPNGRYVIGDVISKDDEITTYKLVFQGVSQDKTDKVRMGLPGFIAASSRN